MPARQLGPAVVGVNEFCVAGEHGPEPGDKYVIHVGLISPSPDRASTGTANVGYGDARPIDHLVRKRGISCDICFNSSKQIHVVGTITSDYSISLTDQERFDLETFLQAVRFDSLVYVADPPVGVPSRAGTRTVRRFSCIGLVLECYKAVGQRVLAPPNSPPYPDATLADIIRVYPFVADLSPRILRKIGLGPEKKGWKLVFPGYLLHALRSGRFPFQPTSLAEAAFP